MTVHYVASIMPNQYAVFQGICAGRMPTTFGEWRASEDQNRRHLAKLGAKVISVCIDPLQLRAYCKSMDCEPDAAALTNLAIKMGGERDLNS
jgi:hypothetical protein